MTAMDRFERELPADLEGLAAPHMPDYLSDILGRTAVTNQRPAWTFPERWFPMADIASRSVVSRPMPWRTIGLLFLLVVVLTAGALMMVGSQRRLPSPFGPAQNGILAFSRDGDLFARDMASGQSRALVIGPEMDTDPYFSLQGDRMSFLRHDGDAASIMVARSDGSDVRRAAGPFPTGVTWMVWSPDGRTMAIESNVGGIPTITIAATDGSESHILDVGMPAERPEFRPTDGSTLLLRGQGIMGTWELYLVNLDGSELQRLDFTGVPRSGREWDYLAPVWSPDGTRIAYHAETQNDRGEFILRIHIADIAPDGTMTGDRKLEFDPEAFCECWVAWSPDGQAIAFQHAVNPMVEVAVGSASGEGAFVTIGEPVPDVQDGGVGFEWAPDTETILRYDWVTGSIQRFDAAGGTGTTLEATGTASWQRR